MRRLAILLTAAAIALPAASDKKPKAQGSFTPVIAKQRLTYTSEQLDGKERMLSMMEGSYLRSMNGSELATLGPMVNGIVKAPTEGRLRIAREGTTYKLDYKAKTATLVAKEATPLSPHSYPQIKDERPVNKAARKGKSGAAAVSLDENLGDFAGFETIQGLKCAGMVLRDHGTQTGTAWRDWKHDLLVRLETIFGSNDDHVLITLERFEIDIRQEPEATYFELPAKWTVIEPAATAQPTTPKP